MDKEGLYNTSMAAIVRLIAGQASQLRPLNILRDLPGVADLVELCFADTMDTEGRNYIQQMRRAGKDNFFLRWANSVVETASLPLSGYIWEENGEIIGNVSLIPFHHSRNTYYLIANVAVRPEFRKRGIGRALTLAAMQHARNRHAFETWLHVRADNPGAIELYRSLGFKDEHQRTTWQMLPDHVTSQITPDFPITRRTARDWPAQQTWLRRLYPDQLSWYQPVPWNSLRPGFGPAIYRLLSDQDIHHWVARTDGSPSAILSWQSSVGQTNRLWVAVPEQGQEVNLTALLQRARNEWFSRTKTSLEFPAGNYADAIRAAGFQPVRTLLWMKNET
jgi:ribosomal protein S18 acetylase RimI-like enzyme